MARLRFPDSASIDRVQATAGTALLSASGATARVYLDEAGTQLADILNADGSANPTATLILNNESRLPEWDGPDAGQDQLYVRVDGGAALLVEAILAERFAAQNVVVTERLAEHDAAVAAQIAVNEASIDTKIATQAEIDRASFPATDGSGGWTLDGAPVDLDGLPRAGFAVMEPSPSDVTIFADSYARTAGIGPLDLTTATAAIASNLLQLTMTSTRGYALAQGFSSDYTDIETVLDAPSATNRAGLAARYVSDSNRGVVVYVSTSTAVAVGKVIAGAFTSLGTLPYTSAAARVRLRLRCEGNQAWVTLDGKEYGPFDITGVAPSGRAGFLTNDSQTGVMGFASVKVRPKPARRSVYASTPRLFLDTGGYAAFPRILRQSNSKVYITYVDGTDHTTGKRGMAVEWLPGNRAGIPFVVNDNGANEQDCFGQVIDGQVVLLSRQFSSSYDNSIAVGPTVQTLAPRVKCTFDVFPERVGEYHAAWFGKIVKSLDGTKWYAPVYGKRAGFTHTSVALMQADPATPQTWTLRSWIVANDTDTLSNERNETSLLRQPDGSLIAQARGQSFGSTVDDGLTWSLTNMTSGTASSSNPTVAAPMMYLVSEQIVTLFRYGVEHRVHAQPLYSGPIINPSLGTAPIIATAAVVGDGGYADAIPAPGGLMGVTYNREVGADHPSLYTFEVIVR